MKEFFTHHPFAKFGLLAVPMLIFILIMETHFPKVTPEGYQSFIVAFEFVRTPEQLHQLFNGLTSQDFSDIDKGNMYDFGFMLFYSLFLFLFFRKAKHVFDQKWLISGAVFSVIILIADFSENMALLKLTEIYSSEMDNKLLIPVLNRLHVFTWIKWSGLAISFAMFSRKMLGKRILLNIEGVALIFPVIFGVWALTGSPEGISKFTLSITLAFALLILYSFHYKHKEKAAGEPTAFTFM